MRAGRLGVVAFFAVFLATGSAAQAQLVAHSGKVLTAITNFALRDTSAAFDVTIAATSAPALTAGRTLTFDMSDVAHTLDLGATANTITFPSAASYTVAALSVAQTWSATQTGMTLSGASLTGATTLLDSGSLSSAGELGLGASPVARFSIGGTYTTAGSNVINITGTLASSITTTQRGMILQPTFAPSGASLTTMQGLQISPTFNSTSFALNAYDGIRSTLTLGASFSGSVTTVSLFAASDPVISGGTVSTLLQFNANTMTNGNGLSSGTVTNVGFFGAGATAGSAGGTVANRTAQFNVPSGGSTSGTTNNRGIYITGNGGTAAGGTVNNFALLSDSTAPIQIGGLFQFLGATSSFPALKRSSSTLQVRLADDSADAPVSASNAILSGSLMVGSGTALTLTAGAVGMQKITASASAPGAAGGKMELVCGTNAGTAKLVIAAGTSATTVTVIDNVGAGVSGC